MELEVSFLTIFFKIQGWYMKRIVRMKLGKCNDLGEERTLFISYQSSDTEIRTRGAQSWQPML